MNMAMTLLSACADNNLGTDRENQSFQNKIRKKIQIPAVPLMEHGSLQTAFSSRPIIRVEK